MTELTPSEKLQFIKKWTYDPAEDSLDRFERIGVMFFKETGYLRPGKSYPMGCWIPEDLNEIFKNWCETQAKLCHEMLDSLIKREED